MSKLVQRYPQDRAHRRDDRFHAIGNFGGADKRQLLVFLGLLQGGPDQPLAHLYVAKKRPEQGLRRGRWRLRQRAKILTLVARWRRVGKIESEERPAILFGEFDEHCARRVPLTSLHGNETFPRHVELAGGLLDREAGSLARPTEDRGIHPWHSYRPPAARSRLNSSSRASASSSLMSAGQP